MNQIGERGWKETIYVRIYELIAVLPVPALRILRQLNALLYYSHVCVVCVCGKYNKVLFGTCYLCISGLFGRFLQME